MPQPAEGHGRREFLRNVGLVVLGGAGLAVGERLGGFVNGSTGQKTPEATPSPTPSPTGTPEATAAPTAKPTEAPVESAAPAEVWRPTNFLEKPNAKEALKLPWANGKYETFPRIVLAAGVQGLVEAGTEGFLLQRPDIGTLGPDVDTIVGVDLPGLVKTGAAVAHFPKDGNVLETRVVFIKRTDLETVQLRDILGGDKFDLYRVSKYGNDHNLDVMAQMHAFNTAREHQMVVYLGDLGLFEKQWGDGEQELLHRLIRAQRPARAGIQEPDFVQPRIFVPGQ